MMERAREALPEGLRPTWDRVKGETVGSEEPLSLCLAGAFSTGKTSLINSLLGRDILPVGLTETTAIPTQITFAPTWQAWLEQPTKRQDIPLEQLGEVASRPTDPQQRQILHLEAPLPWLQGLALVDLPGTGSREASRREYARAQVQSTDAILYLLQTRGPTPEDMEILRLVATFGKEALVTVGQWDLAQAAVSRGEPLPDLGRWAREIREQTGLDNIALLPTSRLGLGREEVINFRLIRIELCRTCRIPSGSRKLEFRLMDE